MSDLMNFDFHGLRVRVVIRDGEPWWFAGDVCTVLGLSNVGQAISRLEADEADTITINDGTPGNPNKAIISEAGVYALTLTSRKPEARAFKRWVPHDVLPSIRKHGMYAKDELLDDPEHLLRVTQKLVEERRARLAAESKILELSPKAEFHDAVVNTEDTFSVADIAKLLGTGEIRLFKWLRQNRILMKNPWNRPYQELLDSDYFRVLPQVFTKPDGTEHVSIKPIVTGKGWAWLLKSAVEPLASAMGV